MIKTKTSQNLPSALWLSIINPIDIVKFPWSFSPYSVEHAHRELDPRSHSSLVSYYFSVPRKIKNPKWIKFIIQEMCILKNFKYAFVSWKVIINAAR